MRGASKNIPTPRLSARLDVISDWTTLLLAMLSVSPNPTPEMPRVK